MTPAEFIKYCVENPVYRVYMKDYHRGYGIPKDMLFLVPTRVIEPGDITESPLNRTEAKEYIKWLNPALKKKNTLDKLIKSGMIKKYRLNICNGHVFLRSEVRDAVKQLEKA